MFDPNVAHKKKNESPTAPPKDSITTKGRFTIMISDCAHLKTILIVVFIL